MLYPAPLRDLLIELAAAKLFRAKWTEEIQNEWIEHITENRPDLDPKKFERLKELMADAVPDCLVENYEKLIPSIQCPDEDDRHVIAAAIKGHCSAIITINLKDFPASELETYNIEAQHPDEFINHQFGLDQAAVILAAKNCRARLKNPSLSPTQYLDSLRKNGLTKTVNELEKFVSLI